ncbi:MAG: CoA transferase, partial [Deltaproteobacteria bacterium]|nr:CoA transferase [Deltaproteobacteria bacterium]
MLIHSPARTDRSCQFFPVHPLFSEFRLSARIAGVKLNTHAGPWSLWPGFDINAGGITGLATAEGTPDQPLPPQQVQVICDIMTGYLGAIGVKAAL